MGYSVAVNSPGLLRKETGVMEHCRPLVNVSAHLRHVAFVDVTAAIKDKRLRACVHIDAAAQAMLMPQFESNTAVVLPKQPD